MAFVHRPRHTLDTGFHVDTFVRRMSIAAPYDRNMYVKQLLELATSQDTKSLKQYVVLYPILNVIQHKSVTSSTLDQLDFRAVNLINF